MKQKRRRLSPCELVIVFLPFPALWLLLGLFVHPAGFKFWDSGQSIPSLDAMILGFTPIWFTVFYSFAMLVCYSTGKTIRESSHYQRSNFGICRLCFIAYSIKTRCQAC